MTSAINDMLSQVSEDFTEDGYSDLGVKAQLLTDLGYLKQELLIDVLKEKQIEEAYQIFYSELSQSGLITSREIEKIEKLYEKQANIKLLQLATDIDEGFQFKGLPEFGQKGIITRIVHYRLQLLGLYTAPIGMAYNANSYFALEKAASFVKKTKLSALNLLADIQGYTAAFVDAYAYKNSLVVFTPSKLQGIDQYPEFKGRFRRRLKKDLKRHESAFEEIDNRIFYRRDDKVDEDFIKKREKDGINTFILRLIQLHQWMGGFYDGLLDADYGEVTLASLKAIIEQYNETVADKVDLGEVLAKIKGDTFIFNALFFLQQYKIENQANDRSFDTLIALSESYEKASDNDKVVFEERMKHSFESTSSNQDILPVKKGGKIRRIFMGIKTFFKKAFRFARKLFRWIVEQVENVASFIANTLKMIYRFFKEAIRHFLDGIKFLLGKLPVVSEGSNGNMAYSNFDIDKDGISIINSNNAALVEMHMKLVNQKVYSMSFSLSLIAFLFQAVKSLVSAGTLVTWPVFVIKLVSAFQKLVKSYKLVITT